MVTLEKEREIEAPVDYTFEWASNFENQQRCTPAILDVEMIGETTEGTRVRSTIKLLGRTTTSEELYIVDEENMRIATIFDDGDIGGEMRWSYRETETGTVVRVTAAMEVKTSLFGQALQPVVSRYLIQQFRNALETMKELVEVEYETDSVQID